MSVNTFNIVFKGEIVAGADEATVKANVAKLFKANDKVLERLFSGEPIAIKKDVDKAAAMKYRALMKQAGAICYAQDPSEPMTPAVKPAVQAAQPVKEVRPETAPAETQQQAGQWTLAAPGAMLGTPKPQPNIVIPDVSGITIAPVGANVLENPPEIEIPDLPDITGIELAPIGVNMAEPVKRNDPPPPDVSAFSLAPVGSYVADPQPPKPALKVDISHIALE